MKNTAYLMELGFFSRLMDDRAELLAVARSLGSAEAMREAADRNCGCCEGYFTHAGFDNNASCSDFDCRSRCRHRAAILGKIDHPEAGR